MIWKPRAKGSAKHPCEQRLASQDRSWPQRRAPSSSVERPRSTEASRHRPATGRLPRRSRPEEAAGRQPAANAPSAAAAAQPVAAPSEEACAAGGLPLPPPLESPRSQVLPEPRFPGQTAEEQLAWSGNGSSGPFDPQVREAASVDTPSRQPCEARSLSPCSHADISHENWRPVLQAMGRRGAGGTGACDRNHNPHVATVPTGRTTTKLQPQAQPKVPILALNGLVLFREDGKRHASTARGDFSDQRRTAARALHGLPAQSSTAMRTFAPLREQHQQQPRRDATGAVAYSARARSGMTKAPSRPRSSGSLSTRSHGAIQSGYSKAPMVLPQKQQHLQQQLQHQWGQHHQQHLEDRGRTAVSKEVSGVGTPLPPRESLSPTPRTVAAANFAPAHTPASPRSAPRTPPPRRRRSLLQNGMSEEEVDAKVAADAADMDVTSGRVEASGTSAGAIAGGTDSTGCGFLGLSEIECSLDSEAERSEAALGSRGRRPHSAPSRRSPSTYLLRRPLEVRCHVEECVFKTSQLRRT